MHRLSLFFLALGLLALGCSVKDSRDLRVVPAQAVVQVGDRLELQACSEEILAEEPTWEVPNYYGGGFLNSRGVRVTYLAPDGAGKFVLILRARRLDGAPLRRIVPVRVLPKVLLHPVFGRLSPGATHRFTAQVKGLARTGMIWSVEEPEGGSIAKDGTYTAPSQPGTFHVIATCTQDPDAIGTAVVVVE